MQTLHRSKSRKFRDKEKTVQEEEEAAKKARHLEKLKAKNNLIKAEFEKHKKRLLLSTSDMSKTFEAQLRFQLNELRANNTKKVSALEGLRNLNERLEEENEYNMISPTMESKIEHRNTKSELYMSLGDTTNRMTSVVDGFAGPEALVEKVAQLKETLENVDILLKVEEETEGAITNKLDELLSDNHLLSRDVNELRKANEHFDKRFSHLKETEFAANAKYSDILKDLAGMRELTKELKTKEKAFKRERFKEKETEEKALHEQQIKLSSVLVALDDKKVEHKEVLEELKKVEMRHEQMIDRKKNTKTLAEFAELIQNLYSFFFTADAPKDALKRLIEPERKGTPVIAIEDHMNDKSYLRRKSRLSNHDLEVSRSKEVLNRDSFINRDFYLEKIENFYDKYTEGPDSLVSRLIELYQEFCFKETSLKKVYEGLQSEKLLKEGQLTAMHEELGDTNVSQRNNTGSQEISEGGIFTVNSQATTMNQAKFLFDTKKETDSDIVMLANTEKFILRCYLDTVEMVVRLGKMLISVGDQADSVIPDRVRRLGKEIIHHISLFKTGRKLPAALDLLGSKELDSITTIPTFTEMDLTNIPDLSEAFQDFSTVFPGFANKASEFVNRLKQDTMIASFIKHEDIQNFLAQFQNEVDIEQESKDLFIDGQRLNVIIVEKVFDNIPDLRKMAVDNMRKRLDLAYSYYIKLSTIIKTCKDECMEFFNDRGQQITFDADSMSRHVPSEHVRNAMARKWEIMMTRYEYDPNIDYRIAKHSKNIPSTTKADQRQKLDEIEEEGHKDEKGLDVEELITKLGEITHQTLCKTGPRSYGDGTAYLSKTKQNEERKRQQVKLNKERMKQELYNMTEEEYLEFKRKNVGRGNQVTISDYQDTAGSPQRASTSYRPGRYRSLEGIKKMIETSKLLSKINILERSKSPPENLQALKLDVLGNYIPIDPIYPKSARTTTAVTFRRAAIKGQTAPGNLTSRANLGGTTGAVASSRNSPTNEGVLAIPLHHDTEARSSFRSNTTHFGKVKVMSPTSQSDLLSHLNGYRSVSKLGDRTPDASPMLQAVLKKSQSQTHRLSKFGDLCIDTISIPLPEKASKEVENAMPKSHRAIIKKQEDNKRQVKGEVKLKKLAKGKPSGELPKLKSSTSENKKVKKTHIKRQSMPEELTSPENLSLHLNINSDSTIKGIYSSRWASSLPPSPLSPELTARRGYA